MKMKIAVAGCLLGMTYSAVAELTMTIGSATRIYTNYHPKTTSDFSCPVLKDPDNPDEVFSWASNGNYAFAKYRGPLNDPQRTLVWSGYPGRWNLNGYPSGYRPWLGNIYKHTDGTLIGFVHIETARYDDPDCQFRQGIAISTNNGDHWRYCGDAINSQLETEGQQNLGGCAAVIVGDYFYQYFNEYETGYYRKPAVARALIADVVAAAKNFTVSPWVKYYNGSWTNNALTQAGSSVLPYPSDRYDAHGDAVYCAPLGKYLMVVYEQHGWDYLTFQASDARKGIYLYTSTDGVNWGGKQHVFTPLAGGDACYPFFAGIDGASDDNLVVGSSFKLFVPDRARHELYSLPITIMDSSKVSAPQISPDGGVFLSSVTVSLSTIPADAEIYYTTDGSEPSESSALYSVPFLLTNSATVNTIGIKNGLSNSTLSSAEFIITQPVAPTAGFTLNPSSGTAPLTVTFTDISTGTITNRFWDFGSGVTTNTSATNLTHVYTNAGTYTVELVVSGPSGVSTSRQTDYISVVAQTAVVITVSGSSADQVRRSDEGSLVAVKSAASKPARIGNDTAVDGIFSAWVIPFLLPDIGTETISSASLHTYFEKTGGLPATSGVFLDLLGVRVSASSTVIATDYQGTVIGDNLYNLATSALPPLGPVEFSSPGLAAYLQSIYDHDANAAGKYVFLTLAPDATLPKYNYVDFTTAEGDIVANRPVLRITLASGPAGDADDDGLPDEWEEQYFGGSTNAQAHALAANGVNTILEAYVAGLNPADPASRFDISAQQAGVQRIFQWSAVSGRIYSVYWTTNLIAGFEPLETNLVWPQNSWTDTVHSIEEDRFYRIKVQLAP